MLTKEQKLEMVSKAIDAGFVVELNFHGADIDTLDKKLEIFKSLPIEMGGHKESQFAWASVNRDRTYDDKFKATVFL